MCLATVRGCIATRKSSLTRGASVMVVSVLLTKVLGLAYVIPLTQLIHDKGLGWYSSAYALYTLLLTLSTSGFPTAMAKVVSERLALHRHGDIEQLFHVTLRLVIVFGVAMFVLMWFGAPLYSHLVSLNQPASTTAAVTLSVRALAPSLLVIPAASALRGYLQGYQRMEPSGYSQAIEQVFRVAFIVAGAYLVVRVLSPGNIAGASAAATFASFVGGLAALVLLIFAVRNLRRDLSDGVHIYSTTESAGAIINTLWRYALPVSLGTLVVPISQQVDALTVPNLLAVYHNANSAMNLYGIYSRKALQLVNVPLAFAFAIGSSILPAISTSHTKRDLTAVHRQVKGTLRSMFFIMFPTAAVLLLLAQPIDYALFNSNQGATIIASVSIMSVFSGLELISTYMLQGLAKMYRPVRNMFIGVAVKLAFVFILIPHFGILGAAASSTIGYLCSSTLNIMAVRKYGSIRFSVWGQITPALISTVITAIPMELLYQLLTRIDLVSSHILWAWIELIIILGICSIFYILLGMRLSAVTALEVQSLPGIGSLLSRIAKRIQPQQG